MTQDFNPYSPPSAKVADIDAPVVGRTVAGKGRRFCTFLIDYLAILALIFCLTFVVAVTLGERSLDGLDEGVSNYILTIGLMSAYYIFFEGLWGRTPGKFICGTVVVTDDNERPSFAKIVGRTFSRFIPFEPLSNFSERGWHDSLSKTKVVLARAF